MTLVNAYDTHTEEFQHGLGSEQARLIRRSYTPSGTTSYCLIMGCNQDVACLMQQKDCLVQHSGTQACNINAMLRVLLGKI
jgi:hypothetical protein